MNGAIENGQQKFQHSFSNQAPFLLISEESVRALVGLIAAEAEATGISRGKIRVENFRPNIVVRICIALSVYWAHLKRAFFMGRYLVLSSRMRRIAGNRFLSAMTRRRRAFLAVNFVHYHYHILLELAMIHLSRMDIIMN